MSLVKKVLNLGVAAVIGLSSLTSVANAEPLDEKASAEENSTNYLEIGLNLFGVYATTILAHEGGHYLAVSALGREGIEMNVLPKRNEGGGVTFASVSYAPSENETIYDDTLFNVAGVASTRLNYELLDYSLDQGLLPRNKFFSTLALFLRFDLPREILCSSIDYYTQNETETQDGSRFVNRIYKERHKPYLYPGLILGEMLDLYFDKEEIQNHFYNAFGVGEENLEKSNVSFDLDFNLTNVTASLKYDFE
jgi:hypothetical protein